MDIVVCFALFLAAMLFCLVKGFSLAWALLFALVLFFALGLRSGYGAKALVKMAWSKMPKSMIVLRILFFIGLLTGLWRSCGTIAFFIYHGIRVITPSLFILVAFLLTVLLSYALGTSFGVASTAGVVLMALARSGGVSEAVTAGVILSGIYFGDRGAPTSSCASLVAALTETDLYGNVSRMFQTAALPYALFDRSVSHATYEQQENGKVVFDGIIAMARENLANGIPVGLGTDTGCPYITHYDMWRELCYFVKYCGVTPAFALHTATLLNARLAGIDGETGSIETGKAADLIVCAKDPLADLSALRTLSMVIKDGYRVEHPAPKKLPEVERELDKFL